MKLVEQMERESESVIIFARELKGSQQKQFLIGDQDGNVEIWDADERLCKQRYTLENLQQIQEYYLSQGEKYVLAMTKNGATLIIKVSPFLSNIDEIVDDPDAKFPFFNCANGTTKEKSI